MRPASACCIPCFLMVLLAAAASDPGGTRGIGRLSPAVARQCGAIGWNAVAVLHTMPCNVVPAGGNVSARIEVWLSAATVARCPARLIVALTPASDKSGTSFTPLSSLSLRAISQNVVLPSPPRHVGLVQLSARLEFTDPTTQQDLVLAADAREVHLLACSTIGDAKRDMQPPENRPSTFANRSCCLAYGFVAKDSGLHDFARNRLGDKVSTPRLAHFVFDIKGPPPRCSYFFFLAVRAAARVLRPAKGRVSGEVGVIVHYHYEPWGPWWAAIKALPAVSTVYVETPSHIFGREVDFYAHHSDVIRLHALLRFGGIYFDSDLVPLQNMDALRDDGRAFLGQQPFGWAGNGVIGAPPESALITRWLQHYHTFQDARRGFWGAYIPTVLAWAFPEEAQLLGPAAFYWPFKTIGVSATVFSRQYDLGVAGNLVAHFYGNSFQNLLDAVEPRMLKEMPTGFACVLKQRGLLGTAEDVISTADHHPEQWAEIAAFVSEEEDEWEARRSQGGGKAGDVCEGSGLAGELGCGGERDCGSGQRRDGTMRCEGDWLGLWPLRRSLLDDGGHEVHGGGLENVAHVGLPAMLMSPRWLRQEGGGQPQNVHAQSLSGNGGVDENQGGTTGTNTGGAHQGVGVRVGGGYTLFAPVFGCHKAPAVTLCFDLLLDIGENGRNGTRPGHASVDIRQIVWSMRVGDDVVVWMEWIEFRGGKDEGSGRAGRSGSGLSLRFRRMSREYQLMFVAKDVVFAVSGGDGVTRRGMRMCVSMQDASPTLVWINGTMVGASRRAWHHHPECALLGGLEENVRGDTGAAGEELQGCSNHWWPLRDSPIVGVWLGGDVLPLPGKSFETRTADTEGVVGMWVARVGLYGGYVAGDEDLRVLEGRERALIAGGGREDAVVAEVHRGLWVEVEEPVAFSFKGTIDEAIEEPYLALQEEHPNCVRVVVRLRTGAGFEGEAGGQWDEVELQVWVE